MISAYRSPGGPGVRLDGGTTHTGAEVSAHFDSMLVKLTCHGHDFAQRGAPGAARDRRVPHPRRVHEPAVPGRRARRPGLPGRAASPRASSTSARSCCRARQPADRGTRLLTYLAETTVNRPHGPRPAGRRAGRQAARARRPEAPTPDGSRQLLRRARAGGVRAPGCARSARSRSPTPRSATPTSRCWPPGCAPATCWPSPRTWRARHRSCCRWSAGAARPTTWRCGSSPRTRGTGSPRCARRCPTSAPRCCCAGATPSATRRTRPRSPTPSSQEAAATGMDIFRIFDALNDVGADAAGDRRRAGHRHRRRRGRALLHRRPVRPGRDALHARLLPAAGRADRRRRARTCWRSRTWPGCCARPPPARW